MKQSNKTVFYLIILAVVCWGRLFYLQAILRNDWYWLWFYFVTDSFSEFIYPFQSLGHTFQGILEYLYFSLFKYFKGDTVCILNILRFFLFTLNGLLIFFIFKNLTRYKNMLPETIGAIYMVSPLVHALEISHISRTIYLFTFLLSLWLTTIILRKKRLNWFYYIGSIILSVHSILGLESFIFVELFRPVIIYYIMSKDNEKKISLKSVILHWSPYILIGAGILLYTMLRPKFGPLADVYHEQGLFSLIGFKHFVNKYIYSIYNLFIGIYAEDIWLTVLKGDILTYLLSIFAALFIGMILLSSHGKESDKEKDKILVETKGIMVFGLLWILAAMFPYMAKRGAIDNYLGSSYALETNVGVAVFISAAIFVLYYKNILTKKICQVIISIIILFGVGICNTIVKTYDNDWQQQRSFWWQFVWRVPDIKGGTFLLADINSEEKFVRTMFGAYEVFGPLNILYASSMGRSENARYLASEIVDREFISKYIIENRDLDRVCEDFVCLDLSKNVLYYSIKNDKIKYGNKSDNWMDIHDIKSRECKDQSKILIQYYPKNMLLTSYRDGFLFLNRDTDSKDVEKRINIKPLVVHSSSDSILINSKRSFPFRYIMGDEPKEYQKNGILRKIQQILDRHMIVKDWRYYYQTAMVLLERKDFDGIVKLYNDTVKKNSYDNDDGIDNFPKLEALLVPFIQVLYITQDYNQGSSLLWQWAIYSNGSLAKAIEMKNNISMIGQYPDSVNRLDKDIKEIFHNL